MTPLEQVKQQYAKEQEENRLIQQRVAQCPPVSKVLLEHLKQMFAPRQLKPSDPSLVNELVMQHGVERVIKYLEARNAEQEKNTRESFTKTSN